ncbi:polysaccharide biosynthesis/export family protein [Jannaschia rubra]|uniref:Putative polysaccharide export protein, PEP-CTERM sytem-associated n=1 Tax=Jannaschia rubra TaxID=282197 RepID=A0A0M6XXH9_9RHOB|nr:polysaccharide biosynthesis/export family protein [Jannaschia rubra]CTQ34785.1 putative polysaccharide export protein, PEP-CTERM sytem-associated [Jannaschia rubra]SFG80314.1 exopolysaccharide production protein ExoF [Jannaschia rubra]
MIGAPVRKVANWAAVQAAGLALMLLAVPAHAEDYPIGAGDELELSIFARPDLSRLYRVRQDGTISLHIVGTIPAAGLLPAELEQDIEDRLAAVFSDTESATLEVASYRPVIVSGDVRVPGAAPFRPGMDVRSAVAISGGFLDTALMDDAGLRMRVADEAANAALMAARLDTLEVTRARLNALRDGGSAADLAETVRARTGQPPAAPLTDAAEAVMSAQAERQALRARTQADQTRLAREEAEAFAERRVLLNGQLDTILEELGNQQDLRERGLARSTRVVDLTLEAASLRVDILEAIGLEAAARQKLERAESSLASDETDRQAELSDALADTEAAILETATRLDRSRAFVREFGGEAALALPGEDGTRVAYLIHRRNGEGARVVEAGPDTLLHPGDGLEVLRALAPDGTQ